MKLLYYLSPIGVGTEFVESFTSYMYRLAAAHTVSLGILNQWLVDADASGETPVLSDQTTSGLSWSAVAMVRPTNTVRDMVALVSRHTGCDELRSTTFLALSELRYRSKGFFDNRLRWCPCCWKEDLDSEKPVYFRLLWCFAEIEACRRHNVRLVAECPHCQGAQHGTGRHLRIERCRQCGKSLLACLQPLASDRLLTREHESPDLRELVLAISADPLLHFQPDAAKCLLGKIFDRVWEIGDERAFWTLAPKDETLAMYTTQNSLSLVVLRRFAHWLGISLPSLLAGEVDCWTGQLDPNWLHHLPKSIRPERRRMRVDRDHVLEQLTELRKTVDDNYPPSLAQVARIVGISSGGLEYLFPEICKDIKRRYQRWKEQERHRLRVEATIEVWKYSASGVEPISRKHALKTIRGRSSLPKNLLREIIAKEFVNTANIVASRRWQQMPEQIEGPDKGEK